MAAAGESVDMADTTEGNDREDDMESVMGAPEEPRTEEQDDDDEEDEHDEEQDGAPDQQPAEDRGSSHHHSSNSSDSGEMDWQEIQQDTTVPSAEEIKEFFTNVTEIDARNGKHWVDQLTTSFEDPEYRPAHRGSITFEVKDINGTREQPNKELIMKSAPVDIGGYTFRILVYPKGNLTNHLAVFLECSSLVKEKTELTDEEKRIAKKILKPPQEMLAPAIPMIGERLVATRASVAAHVILVAYNPADPRVFKQESGQYQFTSATPDWGWSRFAGPVTELGKRERGKRAPLLQNDRICFAAYVQTIHDDTKSLYERSPSPLDSFAKTGLFPLSGTRSTPRALMPAVVAWLLLKPFRTFLMDLSQPPSVTQQPLLTALRCILCSMSTVPSADGKNDQAVVSLAPLETALHWYGIRTILSASDVPQMWSALCHKIREELEGTPFITKLDSILGVSRLGNVAAFKTMRVPILPGMKIQDIMADLSSKHLGDSALPTTLHLELERQRFDKARREWRLVREKINIGDSINIRDTKYVLSGMIVLDGGLKSGHFSAFVRPNGSKTAWYKFSDTSPSILGSSPVVQRLTERQALGHVRVDGLLEESVPLVLIYVQEEAQSKKQSPCALFSEALQEQALWQRYQVFDTESAPREMPPPPGQAKLEATKPRRVASLLVHAISSQTFGQHQGPGTGSFDGVKDGTSMAHKFIVSSNISAEDLRAKLAKAEGNVVHAAQIKFWPVELMTGQHNRPRFVLGTDNVPLSMTSATRPLPRAADEIIAVYCWYHVHKATELTELLKAEERWTHFRALSSATDALTSRTPEPPRLERHTSADHEREDTIMSDADEAGDDSARRVNRDAGVNDAVVAISHERGIPSRRHHPLISPHLVPPPPWARLMQAHPENPDIYFFLKVWDPQKQSLVAHGSYFAKYRDRIDHTVFKHLEVSRDHSRPIWYEYDSCTALTVKRKKTFESYKLAPGCIIIIRVKTAEESEEVYSDAIFEANGFLDLNTHLRSLARQSAFPHLEEPDCVQTLTVFGNGWYEGPLLHQKSHGKGVEIYSNGDKYMGTFKLGERHGSGRLEFANGDVYEGEFHRDKRSGKGRQVELSTGNRYEGEWLKDRPHGEGITHWKKAEKVQGLCSMCWDELSDAVLIDCGHIVGCLACSKRVEQCPVCRKPVMRAIRFYYA